MRTRAFLVLVAVLGLIPLGLAGWGELQVRGGEHVLLRVQPVDPHDLFRGEYVALSYGISSLAVADGPVEPGATVYTPLFREGIGWVGRYATRRRPDTGPFVRGRVEYGGAPARIRYGIETFFVEEGKAREYEDAIGERSLFAEVALSDDGTAKLVRLVVRP